MSSYIPIASQTLGSPASSVTFSSIPTTLNGKTLRDLVLVLQATATSFDSTRANLRFNSDSGSNYFDINMRGDGSVATSAAANNTFAAGASTPTTGGNAIIQLLDYSVTDKHKSGLVRHSAASREVNASSFRWANTSAINTILLINFGDTWTAGSTFSLYGLEG